MAYVYLAPQVRVHFSADDEDIRKYADGGKTELRNEDDQPTGVGADIFIRKKKPGPTINVGYQIDIFENGVKVDTQERNHKKDVKELIDLYKQKYNTNRSFQEENQVHVTYKTKEERGELPPPGAQPQKKEVKETVPTQEPQQGGVFAMESLDQVLIKKAGVIQGLLYRLVDPTIPLTKRAEGAPAPGVQPGVQPGAQPGVTHDYSAPGSPPTPQGDVSQNLPEAPMPGETQNPVNETEIAKQMATKLVNYVQQKAQSPVDDLYNGIKSWMAKVEQSVSTAEKASEKPLNKRNISKMVKDIVSSGDPAKIQQFTGVAVNQQIADVLQKVTLMPIGEHQKPKDQQNQTVSETLGKAASLIEEQIEKLVGETRKSPENDAMGTARAEVLKMFEGDDGVLSEITKQLPDNFSGKTIEKAINQILKENESGESSKTITFIEAQAKDFWKYSGTVNKTASLEKVFEEWINTTDLSFDESIKVWATVNNDVDKLFGIKRAFLLPSGNLQALFHPVVESIMMFAKEPKSTASLHIIEAFKHAVTEYWKTFGINQAAKAPSHEGQNPAEQTLNIITAISDREKILVAEKANLIRDFIINPVTQRLHPQYVNAAKPVLDAIMAVNFSQLLDELRGAIRSQATFSSVGEQSEPIEQ